MLGGLGENLRFKDLSGLDSQLSKKINNYLYDNFTPVNEIEDADIILCHVEPLVVEPWWHCKYIICPCTNTEHIQINKANIKLISLQCAKEELRSITATAHHTIHLMMSLMYLKHSSRLQIPRESLKDARLLIIGNGRIGGIVAQIARVLEMDVYFIDKDADRDNKEDQIRMADIITLHTTCSKDMKPILGPEEFKFIKDGAYIINTSRPEAINYAAIKDNLQRLGGVAEDFVRCEEGDNTVENLSRFNNYICTPHIGGWCYEDVRYASELCFKILQELINARNEKW